MIPASLWENHAALRASWYFPAVALGSGGAGEGRAMQGCESLNSAAPGHSLPNPGCPVLGLYGVPATFC